ncbi:MAG: rRNA maturation RNase YbeY [Hyphomicrobiales bacterium]|nr:MAG: rRNA maturation RNase YbeY [Hyphomicrobiales bacterium]
MINFDILVETDGWPDEVTLTRLVKNALVAVLAEVVMVLPDGAEAAFIFADDDKLQQLNAQWRDKDQPTNVLSFAANDGLPFAQWSPLLGDVIVARETLEREANEQGKDFHDHLIHMIVHGTLHLLGYDHIDEAEANIMEGLETKILVRLNIADPYASK